MGIDSPVKSVPDEVAKESEVFMAGKMTHWSQNPRLAVHHSQYAELQSGRLGNYADRFMHGWIANNQNAQAKSQKFQDDARAATAEWRLRTADVLDETTGGSNSSTGAAKVKDFVKKLPRALTMANSHAWLPPNFYLFESP